MVERFEDTFRGNDEHLLQSTEALLELDAKCALVPHGIGGHARSLLGALASRLENINKRGNTLDDKRRSLFGEVNYELDYQQTKFGTKEDDTINTPNHWVSYLAAYSTKWFTGGFAPYKNSAVDAFRTGMIKVAAIAIAAVESIDRQREQNGRTFYEQSAVHDGPPVPSAPPPHKMMG